MFSFKNITSGINRFKDMTLPVAIAALAKYKGIDDAKEIDDTSLKKTIKQDFSLVSNMVDAAEISVFLIRCMISMRENWNSLTAQQKLAITGTFALGIAGSLYSLTQFGHEQTCFTAGGIATLSCAFFYTAEKLSEKIGTSLVDEKNDIHDVANNSHYVTMV